MMDFLVNMAKKFLFRLDTEGSASNKNSNFYPNI